jgi:hypothetical protein
MHVQEKSLVEETDNRTWVNHICPILLEWDWSVDAFSSLWKLALWYVHLLLYRLYAFIVWSHHTLVQMD